MQNFRALLDALPSRAEREPSKPVAWQWKTFDTWHTAESPSIADPEKYARAMAGDFGKVRAIYTAPLPAEVRRVLEQFIAHYPMGINPFLDDAYRAARALADKIGGAE